MNDIATEKQFPSETICQATTADVDRLVAYAKHFWDQTTYAESGIEYDLETMVDTVQDLIENDDVVLYAENEGKIVGLLCIMTSPFLMNRNYLTACEWGFYVDDEYRSGGLGGRLIQQAEGMLKQKNVKFFTLITLENLHPEAVGKFYERLGFELEESCYVKDLSWAH